MARLLGSATHEDARAALVDALATVPPGCNGLLLYPALTGSRFPDWVSTERGVISGIEPGHGTAHLLRAVQEGAAFTVADALDAIRRCGPAIDEVIVVGGLASQAAALQLRADVLDVPVVTLASEEASSVGAAMLAGACAGIFVDLTTAADVFVTRRHRFEPDLQSATKLANARARWSTWRFAKGHHEVANTS
jgi:sugar (pentulose or hexulose) kinase